MALKHSKTSGKANPPDASIIGGADWDDDHKFPSSTAGKLLAVGAADTIVDIGPPDSCCIIRPSNQTIEGAAEVVDFTTSATVAWDSNTMFSTSNTTRITIKTAGIYLLRFHCRWANPGVTDSRIREVFFYKNGSAISQSRTIWGLIVYSHQEAAYEVELDANDYVEVYVGHGYSSSLALEYDSTYLLPRFSATWLRPAV